MSNNQLGSQNKECLGPKERDNIRQQQEVRIQWKLKEQSRYTPQQKDQLCREILELVVLESKCPQEQGTILDKYSKEINTLLSQKSPD